MNQAQKDGMAFIKNVTWYLVNKETTQGRYKCQ